MDEELKEFESAANRAAIARQHEMEAAREGWLKETERVKELEECLRLELAENLELFDLLGLRKSEDFGTNTSTKALKLKIEALLKQLAEARADNKQLRAEHETLRAALTPVNELRATITELDHRLAEARAERNTWKFATEAKDKQLNEFLKHEETLLSERARLRKALMVLWNKGPDCPGVQEEVETALKGQP